MPYDINENGDTLFTCPITWSVTRKVNKLFSALGVEPVMQATYLALNPDCDAETFFMGRSLWDKILVAAKTDVSVDTKQRVDLFQLRQWISTPLAKGKRRAMALPISNSPRWRKGSK
jgi:hypothetical protein